MSLMNFKVGDKVWYRVDQACGSIVRYSVRCVRIRPDGRGVFRVPEAALRLPFRRHTRRHFHYIDESKINPQAIQRA